MVFTAYLRYRAGTRGFELEKIEESLRYGAERYLDSETGRMVVIAKHHERLVVIPYEESDSTITPITVHGASRRQITFRLDTGRYLPT